MQPIDRQRIDALLFDLDGVVTKTAVVHAAAWKRLFDEFLGRRALGKPWQPFDIERDYRRYVDGKPRRDGVRSFLGSWGLFLPEGMPDDGPEADTVDGLAERKNRHVLAHLAQEGVEAYEAAVAVIREARARGFKIAVISASENCAAVLAAASLADLFDVRVDGTDVARLGLRGKPAPDTFLEAARRLGVEPARAVVFEDSIAGVQAGRAGEFALVVGVDRVGHPEALRRNGAGRHGGRAAGDDTMSSASPQRPPAAWASLDGLPVPLGRGASQGDDDIHVRVNGYWEALDSTVQDGAPGEWRRVVDTVRESLDDIRAPGQEAALASARYAAPPRSVVVLVRLRRS